MLKDAGMSKEEVDQVVLVGGSTRIPKVGRKGGGREGEGVCVCMNGNDDDDEKSWVAPPWFTQAREFCHHLHTAR